MSKQRTEEVNYYTSITRDFVEVDEEEDADLFSFCGKSLSMGGWSCSGGRLLDYGFHFFTSPFCRVTLQTLGGRWGKLMPTCGQWSVSGRGTECARPVWPGSVLRGSGARAEVGGCPAGPGPLSGHTGGLQSQELESKATGI